MFQWLSLASVVNLKLVPTSVALHHLPSNDTVGQSYTLMAKLPASTLVRVWLCDLLRERAAANEAEACELLLQICQHVNSPGHNLLCSPKDMLAMYCRGSSSSNSNGRERCSRY